VLAEFSSVVDAVRCAAEMQRGMIDREPMVPDERRIRFRSATTSLSGPPEWFSARAAIRLAQALAIDPGARSPAASFTARSYLGATRL
jgi:hypothetical protein